MLDVCRKYVGQGDSGSCRRSEKILQDLPAYIPLVYASPASLKTRLCSSTMKQKPLDSKTCCDCCAPCTCPRAPSTIGKKHRASRCLKQPSAMVCRFCNRACSPKQCGLDCKQRVAQQFVGHVESVRRKGMSEGYIGSVCWKGMLEGYVGMVCQVYVGRVCQKGLSGGYVKRR